MARTRNYATEEANYTDATLATSIDNKGTELRVDVREVVNQLIGVAESTALADPVVNQTNGTLNFAATVAVAAQPLTQTQTYVRMYHPYGFTPVPTAAYNPTLGAVTLATIGPTVAFNTGYAESTDLDGNGTAEAMSLFRDLDLPAGVTLTELTLYFHRVAGSGAAQFTFYLYRFDPTTGTATQLGTATTSGSTTGSWLTQAMSLADVTTSTSYAYYLWVSSSGGLGGGARFGGMKADYTSPNANVRL